MILIFFSFLTEIQRVAPKAKPASAAIDSPTTRLFVTIPTQSPIPTPKPEPNAF